MARKCGRMRESPARGRLGRSAFVVFLGLLRLLIILLNTPDGSKHKRSTYFMLLLRQQVRMYYRPGKGVRNSCNSWLLQPLHTLRSTNFSLFNRQTAPLLVIR